MHPSRNTLAFVTLAFALFALPRGAHAQVEARCPTGWDTLPAPGSADQRVVAACAHGQMQLVATELPHRLTPADPDAQGIVTQLTTQIGQGGTVTATPLHAETLGGHASFATEISGTAPNESGLMGRVEGDVVFVPAGANATIVVMTLSHDPAHGNARTVTQAFVPTMVGLDGAPAVWMASASCPADTQDMPSDSPPSNGMRRVARCASEQTGLQFEVLESRLPTRTLDDARAIAVTVTTSLGRGLRRLGGSVSADPTAAATFGTQHGFVTAVHGQATNPQAQAGGPGAQIQIEGQMAVLPTTSGGHVQIVAIAQGGAPEALRARLDTFVRDNLRLDGSGVAAAATAAAAEGDDGGAATPAAEAPHRRHRDLSNIDPNALWHPGDNDRPSPAATDAPAPHEESATKGWIWLLLGLPIVLALFYFLARRRW